MCGTGCVGTWRSLKHALKGCCSVTMAFVLLAWSACSDSSASISRSHDSASQLQPAPWSGDQASSVDLRGLVGTLIDGRDSALGALSRSERVELQELYQPDNAPLWVDAAGRPTRQHARRVESCWAKRQMRGWIRRTTTRSFLPVSHLRVEHGLAAAIGISPSFDVAVSAGMLRYLAACPYGAYRPA